MSNTDVTEKNIEELKKDKTEQEQLDIDEKKEKKKIKKRKKKEKESEVVAEESATVEEQAEKESEELAFDEDGNPIERKRKKRRKKKVQKKEDINIVKELLSLIIYIGIVVLICYFIINFVGCRSKVDGSSMNPTLENGDNLWVDKLSYTFGDPKRFDVVIFNYDEDTTYVKRIIGLPGETVRIDQNGNIYINGSLLKENYGKETILDNGRAGAEVYLGSDEYFVLGDNRNNSIDSRWSDVGNVNREDIVGKAVLRIYPFKKFGFIK